MKEKYKKENLEPIVKQCRNWTEVLIKLGMGTKGSGRSTLKKYVELYNIDISHFESDKDRFKRINGELGRIRKIPLEDILVENSTYTTVSNLKERLYKEGYKERECELCGQGEEWRGKKMSLILDHINGNNRDHRLENLRIVCPNCNATLPTHCRGYNILKRINESNKIKAQNKTNKIIKGSNKQRKVTRPPYDQLIKETEELGFSATGRKYGVSDNAIRKWIRYYEKYEIG